LPKNRNFCCEVRVFWEWPIWLEPALQQSPVFLRTMDADRQGQTDETGVKDFPTEMVGQTTMEAVVE